MPWPLVLNTISTFALVGAVVFAAIGFRSSKSDREKSAAIELVRTMQDGAWEGSVLVIAALPSPGTPHLDALQERAAAAVGIRLETLGYQVFNGVVPLTVVDDLVGGIARLAWSRLSPWVVLGRDTTGNSKSYEWFEWLAERLYELPGTSEPAYLLYSDWKPSK